MSLNQILKSVMGLTAVLFLTLWLPFFDNLPWNLPAYRKRAVVSENIRALVGQPPVTWSSYRANPSPQDSVAKAMKQLKAVYPSPIRMIFRHMRWHPESRGWGLVAVSECSPTGTLLPQYAPPLEPLIKWIRDSDPLVASNALAVLQNYVVLPPDYFEPGGFCHQRTLQSPSEWHAVYDHWIRKEKTAWSPANLHYYCKRNWPPPIR